MTVETSPVLAAAAEMLSAQLQGQIRRLAQVLEPHRKGLERRFLAHLQKQGYDPRQRKALAAVTPLAAAAVLARRKPLWDFFEQVEYNGRRLAKLDVTPARLVRELKEAGALAASAVARVAPKEAADLEWVQNQLQFGIVLTLNNAFYQVREAEAEAYYALFQAELVSRSHDELSRRFLAILADFCQAPAARLFLMDAPRSVWRALAGTPEPPGPLAVSNSPALQRKLSRPRYIRRGRRGEPLLLDPGWRGEYESCWSIPLLRGRRIQGVMQFAFRKPYGWLPRELQLLAAAAERFLQASEKAQMTEDLASREQQIRQLAAQMMQIEEAERERISQELHDEAGQSLLCLRLQLELLERSLPRSETQLRRGLAETREVLERTIVEMRRLIADLSPAVLEHLGLAAALRQLVSRFRRTYGIAVRLRIHRLEALPKRLQRVVYRLVQECSSNAGRHSSASHLNISLATVDNVLRLRVEDDGLGFDVEEALARGGTFGLAGMRERVTLLGGRFAVESRPGKGTRTRIDLPIPDQEDGSPAQDLAHESRWRRGRSRPAHPSNGGQHEKVGGWNAQDSNPVGG